MDTQRGRGYGWILLVAAFAGTLCRAQGRPELNHIRNPEWEIVPLGQGVAVRLAASAPARRSSGVKTYYFVVTAVSNSGVSSVHSPQETEVVQ